MSKHTPGPWVYNHEAEACLSSSKSGICFTGDIGGFVNPADGVLAAAAPELLAALKIICEELDKHPSVVAYAGGVFHMAAREAIAKAVEVKP